MSNRSKKIPELTSATSVSNTDLFVMEQVGVSSSTTKKLTANTLATYIVAQAGSLSGTKGQKGEAGDTGVKGDKGDPGTAGTKGDAGTAGIKGDAGTAGAKGDAGSPGDKGQKGEPGTGGGGSANNGNITFDDVSIIGEIPQYGSFTNGLIRLIPNNNTFPEDTNGYTTYGQYLDIYPTNQFDSPHIHIAAGKGEGGDGDLILGDDLLNVEINHQGYVGIKAYDQLRNNKHYWYFGNDGVLSGPGMGTVIVPAIAGTPGNDLYIGPGSSIRNTTDLQFTNADGSFKTTYTVDTNAYYVGNIPPTGAAYIWYGNGQSVQINSIVLGSGTATFTLSNSVGFDADTTYTVEWYGTDTHGVTVGTSQGTWRFRDDGSFENEGSYTRTTTPLIGGGTTSDVIWTSLYDYTSSAKLTIQLEKKGVGEKTGGHTQVCEAMRASRGGLGSPGEPIMTVYGVTYTSTVPLVSFSVQRNLTNNKIEVVATRTAATTSGIDFRIHSVEMASRD